MHARCWCCGNPNVPSIAPGTTTIRTSHRHRPPGGKENPDVLCLPTLDRCRRTPVRRTRLAGCGQSAGSSAGASGSSPDGRNPDELVFAAVPSENAQSLQQDYQPLITLLQKETGKKIRFQSATSYSAVIEAQRTDKADIVQYGPFSLITAQNSGVKATPIAAQTVKKGATPDTSRTASPGPAAASTRSPTTRARRSASSTPTRRRGSCTRRRRC